MYPQALNEFLYTKMNKFMRRCAPELSVWTGIRMILYFVCAGGGGGVCDLEISKKLSIHLSRIVKRKFKKMLVVLVAVLKCADSYHFSRKS